MAGSMAVGEVDLVGGVEAGDMVAVGVVDLDGAVVGDGALVVVGEVDLDGGEADGVTPGSRLQLPENQVVSMALSMFASFKHHTYFGYVNHTLMDGKLTPYFFISDSCNSRDTRYSCCSLHW